MSPRSVEAFQLLRDERQDQILRAALQIFARQGYAAAKISAIAAQAGVSYGLIDHYFGKKKDLYAAVLRHAFEGALRILETSLGLPASPWERLRYFCGQMLAGVQKSPEFVLLVIQLSTSDTLPPETRHLLETHEKRSLEIQLELIRQGQAAGQVVPGDPLELVMLLNAVIQGLAIQSFDPHLREPDQAHFPDVDSVLRVLQA